MKIKHLILSLCILALTSCVDQTKRLEHLKSIYPNCKVEPSAGLIQQNGYEFIVIDSTQQIIAVSFYPFSDSRINSLRNIR